MKNLASTLLFFLLVSILTAKSQSTSVKNDYTGNWKFDAPWAPEGYTSGIIAVSLSEKKNTATITFTGREDKYQGENVRTEKDSLLFSVYIEGENVILSLKIENTAKISGKAVYSEGVIPLTLVREPEKKN
jgi:hypothetical protein